MNRNQLRNRLLALAIASASTILMAQMQSTPMAPAPTGAQQPGQQSTNSMQDISGGNGMNAQSMNDKMFLHKAAEGGMAEVQLGQLAAEKASSDDVKAFGQKMVTDHTALNEELKPIAQSRGVSPPKKLNKKNQAEFEKLSGLSGADFDNEYLTVMVKDHRKDLRDFQDEANMTSDATLKDAVIKAAGIIQQHSVMVDKLATEKGIAVAQKK